MTATLAADFRFALRMLAKSPGFTAIAVSALALGIGANIAIFTVVNSVILNPLPYPQPERIMRLARSFPRGTGYSISFPKYNVWKDAQAFESIAIYDFGSLGMNIGTAVPPVQVKATHVSAGYFPVFGVKPIMGRTFSDEEDRPGGPQVAVISHQIWQSRFAADPRILQQTLLLNGSPYAIAGVLPAGFAPEPTADVFLPIQPDPNSTNQGHYLTVAGRLRNGVSLDAAKAELKAMGERYRQKFPASMPKEESVTAVSMREAMVGDVRVALLVLLGAVGLVLLIACANVANLLLVRASVRQREMSIRAAMGATRSQLVRQLLTESILLSGLGAIIGFVLGNWGVRVLLVLVPGDIPRLTQNGVRTAIPLLDPTLLIFTIGIALLTGLIFGTLPALHSARANIMHHLKESGGRTGTSKRQNRLRSFLVVGEVALAVVLLVGAGLLLRTLAGLQNVNAGLDPHNILTMETSLAGGNYRNTAAVDNLSVQALRRIQALPSVASAASMIALPVATQIDLPFSVAGRAPKVGEYEGDEQWRSVSPGYFSTFQIPVLRGRDFALTDTGSGQPVVLINEAMAKRYWKDQDAVGAVITIGKGLGPQFADPPRVVIGVVGTVRETGLRNADVGVMYIPQSQVPEGLTALANGVLPLSWAVRTSSGNPMTLQSAVEQELRAVDGQLPITRVRTMEQVIATSVSRQQFNAFLLAIFAGVALILAAIGVYGLMSYSVEQRAQEFGVRLALGASGPQIRTLVLWRGVILGLVGVAVGIGLAYALTRLLASLLFGVTAADPLVFVSVAAVLALVSLLAALVPAMRATAIDPLLALRSE